MQHQARSPEIGQTSIGAWVTIFPITDHRVADRGRMYPYLVHAAGLEPGLDKSRRGEAPARTEDRRRGLALSFIDDDAMIAFPATKSAQATVDAALTTLPGTMEQGQITFLDITPAEQTVEFRQQRAVLGQQQTTRGRPIETVNERDIRRVGTQGLHDLDDAVPDLTPTMHGQPRGLVDDDDPVVLIENRGLEHLAERIGRPSDRAYFDLQRWQAYLVTGLQSARGLRAPFVDANLPRPEQPIESAPRQALEFMQEKVIDPLPGMVTIDGQPADPRTRALGASEGHAIPRCQG